MTNHASPSERTKVRRTPAGGLVDAIECLASASSMDDVVETVRSGARRLIGSDGIAVILREGDECRYLEEDAAAPLWKVRNFPLSTCISGWAKRAARGNGWYRDRTPPSAEPTGTRRSR